MIPVHITRHLHSFFPQLVGREVSVEATDVAGVVAALDAEFPGIAFYICDERRRLRPHVNIFIGKNMVKDRRGLTDAVGNGDEIHIIQALSGG